VGEFVIGLTAYLAFYTEERPRQSLANQALDAVYKAASACGMLILEKYGIYCQKRLILYVPQTFMAV
jgi:hypothetical protein